TASARPSARAAAPYSAWAPRLEPAKTQMRCMISRTPVSGGRRLPRHRQQRHPEREAQVAEGEPLGRDHAREQGVQPRGEIDEVVALLEAARSRYQSLPGPVEPERREEERVEVRDLERHEPAAHETLAQVVRPIPTKMPVELVVVTPEHLERGHRRHEESRGA